MDRGVKIAIFVASIVSLALGLIWDQVLNQARTVAQQHTVDELGPELISAVVGPPEVPRLQPPDGFEARPPAQDAAEDADATTPTDPAATTTAPTSSGWEEYTLQRNDSAWALAHDKFRDRGLTVEDLEAANPGCKWRVGDKVRIPPKGGAAAATAPASTERQPTVAGYPNGANANGPIEYVVQENDSWWKIAHVHFKDRGRSSEEIEGANPGKKLRPGVKITIP